MDRFVGKIAVVTGASRGIGEKIAKELLRRGVNVVGIARKTDKLQALSEEIASLPKIYVAKFYFLTCDVSKDDDIKETFSKIKSTFGAIAILINNAAIIESGSNKTSQVESQLFDQIFDTNVKGHILCTNEAVKLMADSSVGGHIVNINSIVSLPNIFTEKCSMYVASKKAARSFANALRRELAKQKQNIKVSIVSPGQVNTDMIPSGSKPQNPDLILAPEDVANGCIAVLDTPPNVVVMEYTLIPKHSTYQ